MYVISGSLYNDEGCEIFMMVLCKHFLRIYTKDILRTWSGGYCLNLVGMAGICNGWHLVWS